MTTPMLGGGNQICPFCRSLLAGDEVVRCHSCGTAHHRICWSRHHRCSIFGCTNSMQRRHLFTFRMTAVALLVPVFVLMIFSAITFCAAAFEFGVHAGYQVVRSSLVLPAVLLATLLLCGFYTFYIELLRE